MYFLCRTYIQTHISTLMNFLRFLWFRCGGELGVYPGPHSFQKFQLVLTNLADVWMKTYEHVWRILKMYEHQWWTCHVCMLNQFRSSLSNVVRLIGFGMILSLPAKWVQDPGPRSCLPAAALGSWCFIPPRGTLGTD